VAIPTVTGLRNVLDHLGARAGERPVPLRRRSRDPRGLPGSPAAAGGTLA
jgi:hypothetical protein